MHTTTISFAAGFVPPADGERQAVARFRPEASVSDLVESPAAVSESV